jgi:hypothetical protein
VRATDKFSNLNEINELARVIMQTNKHRAHPQIFLLLKLTLILSVATTSMESIFRNEFYQDNFQNKMCDQWMNDYLITYVEKSIFDGVNDSAILHHFQKIRTRKIQLSENEREI